MGRVLFIIKTLIKKLPNFGLFEVLTIIIFWLLSLQSLSLYCITKKLEEGEQKFSIVEQPVFCLPTWEDILELPCPQTDTTGRCSAITEK